MEAVVVMVVLIILLSVLDRTEVLEVEAEVMPLVLVEVLEVLVQQIKDMLVELDIIILEYGQLEEEVAVLMVSEQMEQVVMVVMVVLVKIFLLQALQ